MASVVGYESVPTAAVAGRYFEINPTRKRTGISALMARGERFSPLRPGYGWRMPDGELILRPANQAKRPTTLHSVTPWFGRKDYPAHRVLDPKLPESFESWEAGAKAGPRQSRNRRVVILPNEFSRWCICEGRAPDAAARVAFAALALRRVSTPR